MQGPGHEGKVIGSIFDLVAHENATSRAGIARATGLARSTVGQYVDRLLAHDLLVEVAEAKNGAGRPSRTLHLGQKAGIVAVAELGLGRSQIAVLDLGQNVLGRTMLPQSQPTEKVAASIASAVADLVSDLGRDGDLRWLVLSIPSPVDAVRGMAESVSRSGHWWDGVPFVEQLHHHLSLPITVENDANLRAIAEARRASEAGPLIYVHLSNGLGAGIVGADGVLYRGADGVAGDIGHMRLGTGPARPCACGREGCVGDRVTLRSVLMDVGFAEGTRDGAALDELLRRVRTRDRVVLDRVREYSSLAGELIAAAVNFYNPRSVVLGGELADLGDEVLSGVRSSLYEHALPIVSRNLSVRISAQRVEGGLVGGGYLAAQGVLAELGRSLSAED